MLNAHSPFPFLQKSVVMDITQLRHFVRVAETGSFIKAADGLDVAQPTLSRQIRALEVELRASLFYRHGRGVLLTDAGKRFLENARAVLHAADAALLSVRDAEAVYEGRFVLGLTPSVGRLLLPTLLPQLVQRFPRAAISVVEGVSGTLYEKVLLGQLDFAVLHNPQASPHVEITPLAFESLYLIGRDPVGSNRASVTMAAVGKLPLIMPNRSHAVRPILEAGAARLGLQLNIQLEIDATVAVMDMVSQGMAYSVVPWNQRSFARPPKLSWQKIVRPTLEATLCMVTLARGLRNPLPREAARLTQEVLVALLATSHGNQGV